MAGTGGEGEGDKPFRVDWCFLHNLQCAIKAGLKVPAIKAVLKKVNRFVATLKRSSRYVSWVNIFMDACAVAEPHEPTASVECTGCRSGGGPSSTGVS